MYSDQNLDPSRLVFSAMLAALRSSNWQVKKGAAEALGKSLPRMNYWNSYDMELAVELIEAYGQVREHPSFTEAKYEVDYFQDANSSERLVQFNREFMATDQVLTVGIRDALSNLMQTTTEISNRAYLEVVHNALYSPYPEIRKIALKSTASPNDFDAKALLENLFQAQRILNPVTNSCQQPSY